MTTEGVAPAERQLSSNAAAGIPTFLDRWANDPEIAPLIDLDLEPVYL